MNEDERDRMRAAETLVPCPACRRCVGCGGIHMVTQSRAKQIESGEVDDRKESRRD